MADLTIAASGVVPQADVTVLEAVAFEAIAIGSPIYADSANSYQVRNAIASGTAAQSAVIGIALTQTQGAGQKIKYAANGHLTLTGTTMGVGMPYFLSTNSGKIAPMGDLNAALTNTLYSTAIGIATNATTLQLAINPSSTLRA